MTFIDIEKQQICIIKLIKQIRIMSNVIIFIGIINIMVRLQISL